MDDALKKILSGEAEPEPKKPEDADVQTEAEKKKQEEDRELQAKAEQLENLNKAITEAQGQLRDIRKARKHPPQEDDEEEIPKINFDDPSAKAWNKHIKENVDPLKSELEKGREEIRRYALREFLKDKPALAKNPEKVKELMEVYEKIRTASETNQEGVLMDLDRAFAAVYHEELIAVARNRRVEQARNDALFSDPAVSRGSTSYSSPKDETITLSKEEQKILAQWGMTPEDWVELKKSQSNRP